MNRVSPVAVVLFAVFLMAFSPNARAENTLNINFIYSQQNMEKWQNELKELPAYGIEGDIAMGSFPVNLWLGVSSGKDSGKSVSHGITVNVDASHTEMYVGIRRYMMIGSFFAPYISAAISTVKAEVSGNVSGVSSSSSGTSTGYLLNAGLLLRFGNINIGADFRALSGTSLGLAEAYSNANYSQMGIVLGLNF